ncbi:hypothetical protein HDU98_010997 [Podochytrium sp. JEL0797]|nr:hypothetical protein HDU98_010997 [Podochytrium sp. JEL0797]
MGKFVRSFDIFDSFLAQPITLTIGSQTVSFAAGSSMTNQTSTIFLDADANNYPLDTFSTGFNIRGFYTSNGLKTPLPIIVKINGEPLGWNLGLTAFTLPDNTAARLTLTASRDPTTITFSILILALMWAMALLATFLAYSTWFKPDQKLELPYLITSISLLFAMPTIRNAMPNAPAIGVLCDQMVLGWALMLLSLSVMSHFVNLMWNLWKEHYQWARKLKEGKREQDETKPREGRRGSEETIDTVGLRAESAKASNSNGGDNADAPKGDEFCGVEIEMTPRDVKEPSYPYQIIS